MKEVLRHLLTRATAMLHPERWMSGPCRNPRARARAVSAAALSNATARPVSALCARALLSQPPAASPTNVPSLAPCWRGRKPGAMMGLVDSTA